MSNNQQQQDTESSSSINIEISRSSNTDNEPHAQSDNINTSNPQGLCKISFICNDGTSKMEEYDLREQNSDSSPLSDEVDNYLVVNPDNFKPTKMERTEDILKEFILELTEIISMIKNSKCYSPNQKIIELNQHLPCPKSVPRSEKVLNSTC
ncbi:Hypothetical_protein [Hexamita inflata]|uniref:Hypothetical_protein n=1 Tax=Hexamita inflata TaxID=28002 RepID=A0AA86N9A0_9EUKA|nr:Hypothetical protein HINF_LOCUS2691 [Hexamita inflata]